MTLVSSPLVPQPCTPRAGASTPTANSRPVDRFHAPSLQRLFVRSDDRAHFYVLHSDTVLQVGSLKLRWQCRTKVIRVMTSEVFLGQKYWLRVSFLTVLWETSKEHHSQFGVFKEGSSPQRGRSLQSILAFFKTLCTLGKLIEVRKREKDKKANALAKQGKKMFLCQFRLKNGIRCLWKLASELSMHVFRLSLPGV